MDLHIHTNNSDGKHSVRDILKMAEKAKLSTISLTDHNTVKAYKKLKECRNAFSGKIVPGVELSTTYNGELIEILGYGFNICDIDKFISDSYYSFEDKSLNERLIILETYNKRGVVLDDSFCYNIKNNPRSLYDPSKGASRPLFLEEIKRHPENAFFFGGPNQMEKTTERSFLRDHIANLSSLLYVDLSSLFPSMHQIIDTVHNAGGKTFIAHTFLYSEKFTSNLENIIKEYHIDGIECYHSFFTDEQSDFLLALCDKNGLLKSGGSDFHGGTRTDCILGKSNDNREINIEISDIWLKGIDNYV